MLVFSVLAVAFMALLTLGLWARRPQRAASRRGFRILKPALYLLAFVLFLVTASLAGTAAAFARASAGDPPPFTQPLPARPAHDPNKLTAVLVAGTRGTEIIDFLPPYEILASSGAFNVYAVAPERRVLPFSTALHVLSGLEFIPHYSFTEYDQAIGTSPDLIVIPALRGYDPSRDAAILTWVQHHAGPRTILLTICAGAGILADTGLMDGHAATATYHRLEGFKTRYPNVRWTRNTRYVEDAYVISSSSLTSGIDATLHTVGRLVGRSVANEVAEKLRYPHTHYLDDPTYEPPAVFALDGIAHAALRSRPSTVGLVLFDGISEFALGSVVDTYGISLARLHSIGAAQGVVASKHGLALVPRWDRQSAPDLDRLLVAGDHSALAGLPELVPWAHQRYGRPVDLLQNQADGFVYDAALLYLARTEGNAIAAAAASNLVYPAGHLVLDAAARSPILPPSRSR
jgi:AraC family transcriptional regulator, transcriptional activator FtrA